MAEIDLEVDNAALALYSELKRCLRKRDFESFEQRLSEARKIAKAAKLGRTSRCLINKMADLHEADGKTMLHLAALIAAKEDDTRFFVRLLDLKFPVYTEDDQMNLAPFFITQVENDSKFLTSYYALIGMSFDLNYPNKDGMTFLQTLLITGEISMNKIQGIIQTRPNLTIEIYD
jgi:hypothetical protein